MASDGQHGRCISSVPCGLAGCRERHLCYSVGQHLQDRLHVLPCSCRAYAEKTHTAMPADEKNNTQ
jgi:hypothetical protein